MNPDFAPLRTLLHEVLPSADNLSGAGLPEVLHMVRDERSRRHRFRRNAALLAGLAALISAALWKAGTPVPAPIASTESPRAPAPLTVRQVNDEQLFALLKDTPAALVKLPDGTSRLLVLDQ